MCIFKCGLSFDWCRVEPGQKTYSDHWKIKRACADRMLEPGFSAFCKAQLVYASNEFEVLFTRENQMSVAEHWVSERFLL